MDLTSRVIKIKDILLNWKIWSAVALIIVFTAGGMYGYYTATLPTLEELEFPETVIRDIHDRPVETITPKQRKQIPLADIPKATRQAFITAEDTRFYHHRGLDLKGILRALWANIRAGEIVEGGSTITQQLAKNAYLSPERSLLRKVREAFVALVIESRHTKEEILESYLNRIYFGHGAYGIQRASEVFFNKDTPELMTHEGALLAAIPRSPRTYSPFINPKKARSRRNHILETMESQGYIDRNRRLSAEQQTLPPAPHPQALAASEFIHGVLAEIENKLNWKGAPFFHSEGIQIYTTLDQDLQKRAEQALGNVPEIEGMRGLFVLLDPKTGAVRALAETGDGEYPGWTNALKTQGGSTFKPFTYAAALMEGYTTISTFRCEPVEYQTSEGIYRPTDADGGYHYGELTLRDALTISDNVISVKINDELGPEKSVYTARKMGLENNIEPVLSFPLGSLEVNPIDLASAYLPLAAAGQKTEVGFIRKIEDQSGRILYERKPKTESALDEQVAYITTDMLRDVIRQGTARSIGEQVDIPTAGKTGTTDNKKDALFIGYTPELLGGVYLGRRDKKSLPAGGGGLAAPVWGNFLSGAGEFLSGEDFPVPEGLVFLDICMDTLKPADEDCDGLVQREVFIPGTEPEPLTVPKPRGKQEQPPIEKPDSPPVPDIEEIAPEEIEGPEPEIPGLPPEPEEPAGEDDLSELEKAPEEEEEKPSAETHEDPPLSPPGFREIPDPGELPPPPEFSPDDLFDDTEGVPDLEFRIPELVEEGPQSR